MLITVDVSLAHKLCGFRISEFFLIGLDMSQFSNRNEPVAITIEDSELFLELSVFNYFLNYVQEFFVIDVIATISVKFSDQIVLAKQLVELNIVDVATAVHIE